MKNNSSSAQPDVNGRCMVEPSEVVKLSLKHFKLVYSNSFYGVGGSCSVLLSRNFLRLPPEMDTLKAVKP